MIRTDYVFILAIMTVIFYINHLIILKRVKSDKSILLNSVIGCIILAFLSLFVYDICS